jgi:hypothetical protein
MESLEKKFEELKAKEEEFRKYAEYHNRKMKDPDMGERGFKKHKAKEEYWRMKWSNAGLESQRVMGDIATLKLEGQKKEYGIRVTAFYGETVEYLITLKDALEKKDMVFASQVVDDLEQIYLRGSSLDKEDLQPISGYLSFQSIRIRLGRIVEEQGEEVKINASVGTSVGAQKRSNIATWIGQLTGQIDTLIKDLEKRVNGSTK